MVQVKLYLIHIHNIYRIYPRTDITLYPCKLHILITYSKKGAAARGPGARSSSLGSGRGKFLYCPQPQLAAIRRVAAAQHSTRAAHDRRQQTCHCLSTSGFGRHHTCERLSPPGRLLCLCARALLRPHCDLRAPARPLRPCCNTALRSTRYAAQAQLQSGASQNE